MKLSQNKVEEQAPVGVGIQQLSHPCLGELSANNSEQIMCRGTGNPIEHRDHTQQGDTRGIPLEQKAVH